MGHPGHRCRRPSRPRAAGAHNDPPRPPSRSLRSAHRGGVPHRLGDRARLRRPERLTGPRGQLRAGLARTLLRTAAPWSSRSSALWSPARRLRALRGADMEGDRRLTLRHARPAAQRRSGGRADSAAPDCGRGHEPAPAPDRLVGAQDAPKDSALCRPLDELRARGRERATPLDAREVALYYAPGGERLPKKAPPRGILDSEVDPHPRRSATWRGRRLR